MPDIKGKKVLITAGPTHEPIDPVRFIGNHSSGKMGIAIAEEALANGAEVTLICGPSNVKSSPKIKRIDVQSAQNMFDAVMAEQEESDVLILSAAVADYRPKNVAENKIKKTDTKLTIELEPTSDILASLGQLKRPGQLLIGFALETNNELQNAKGKLIKKNCDLLVLNSLQDAGAGFGHDTNKVSILDRHNNIATFELKSKTEVAKDILRTIIDFK
ncbi:MAG: phosphopantothenoylcysteine decarboxylase/phosphopantothenate--cysteine ligase [Bacteroidia bacterium]|jgi:phosphopantothenoylcysteine decarboxylase/phosphopantothenate--cysteine ligase